MNTYEKIENWAENTKDIDSLRNAFIEIIANNHIDLSFIYECHKKSIETTNQKDQHI